MLCRVGVFREDIVAGEEPELCQRLRSQGWHIWRLPQDMAWHDAAMTRFQQWWRRSTRTGFGNAQRVWLMQGAPAEASLMRQVVRAWVWAGLIPLATLVALLATGPIGLVLLLVYPLQTLRIASNMGRDWGLALERAFFTMLGKFPELIGQLIFWTGANRRRGSTAFDYKS